MADLDYRFDDVIEEHYDRQLAEVRAFARQADLGGHLALEIGSNRGQFLAGLAARHPERRYVGVELRKKWAEEANARLDELGLDHAHVLRADALFVLPIVFDPGQIDEVFVLYPDPWWKRRHRKRRIIRDEFLDLLAPRMAPGAPLWVRTDVGPLAHDMRDVLLDHPAFEPMPLADYPARPLPCSTRDTVTLRNELPVQLVYFRRVAALPPQQEE